MEAVNVPYVTRLVIVAPNWLGDAVLSLPAIADIRRALAGRSIAIAAKRPIAPLFTLIEGPGEHVEQVEIVDANPVSLSSRSFDAALLLPNSFHSAFIAWRAGIAERWGYSADWRRPLLTRPIPRPSRLHQAASYQHLVEALGFPVGPTEPRLQVSSTLRESGAQLLRGAGWDGLKPLVALAPGAAFGSAKRWPPSSFGRAAARLERDGVGTVLVGSAADVEVGAEIERSGKVTANLVGKTDLPALAGVLAQCRALVTNDSGAMHFGAALGLPVTAMFGPTDERETHPIGPRAPIVLTHPVWCRPCMLRDCPIDHRCMRGITVDAVLSAVHRAM